MFASLQYMIFQLALHLITMHYNCAYHIVESFPHKKWKKLWYGRWNDWYYRWQLCGNDTVNWSRCNEVSMVVHTYVWRLGWLMCLMVWRGLWLFPCTRVKVVTICLICSNKDVHSTSVINSFTSKYFMFSFPSLSIMMHTVISQTFPFLLFIPIACFLTFSYHQLHICFP